MNRRPRAEMQFGSDSFLDVVCNVVGILIILMVVAGVRAAKTPVRLPLAEVAIPTAIPLAEPDSLPILVPMTPEEADFVPEESTPSLPVAMPAPELEPAPVLPDVPLVAPPPLLIATAEELSADLQQLITAAERQKLLLETSRRRQAELQAHSASLEKQQAQQTSLLADSQGRRAATETELAQLRRVIAELSQQMRVESEKSTPSKTLAHRITPLGQTVTGQELHFRLVNNRVTVVPLDRLIDRLKSQIERHKEWLAKSRQQLGQVGPIDGFTMHYVVERESGSVVDELRMGPGVFRITVSEWRLEIDRSVTGESVAEALRPGSEFMTAVTTAGDGAAMTFWVYPDSFSIYTDLKAYCQQQNFLIAGRPLPMGIPIAGSPTGSRSTGQ